MLNSRHEARWQYALKIATKIDNYLKKGYIVYDEDHSQITSIEILENEVVLHGEGYTSSLFLNDQEWDMGVYTPIYKMRENYQKWTVLHPKDYKFLVKGKRNPENV